MSNGTGDPLVILRAVNERAAFNRWCGFVVESAGAGKAQLGMEWRDDMGQYSGYLHAGIVGALLDTACGFAAFTVVGEVLASHATVNFLRPAQGRRFIARAEVVKAGRQQSFTRCELFSVGDGAEKLVATGEALLITVPATP